MNEKDEPQGETFNQDQQEMFQHPDASLGETRPRTPGEPHAPAQTNDVTEQSKNEEGREKTPR